MASTVPRAAAAAVRVRDPADRAERETARLYAEYGTRIYRHCLGQLRSHEDAEDAVQNTFVRVHTALRRGVVPEFEAPWLYKIAHNVCLSRRLSATRRARVETPHDLNDLESRVAGPERVHDELVGLDGALAEMPPHMRRAILLREWQGLSYAEVAERLGVSHSAVETLIFRARRRLAQALERPSRKATGLFDFGSLLGTVKTFLGGAGAVKLAAGTAVLAVALVGGIEAEHAVHGGLSHPARAGAPVPADRIPPAPGGAVGRRAAAASAGPASVAASGRSRPGKRGGLESVRGKGAPGAYRARSRGDSMPGRDAPQSPAGSGAASPQSPSPGTPTAPGTPTTGEPTAGGGSGASPTIPSPTLPTAPDPTLPTAPDPTLPDPTLPDPTLPSVTAPLPTDTSALPTVPTLP